MDTIYLLTAVDVRRSEEAGSGRPLSIASLAMPPIRLLNASHNPGGGVGSVNFVLPRIEAPEPAFASKGIDADIFRGFGETLSWTFAGAYRNKRTNLTVPARAIITGAISAWEPDESSPEEMQGCNHIFQEVTHYEFILDGKELWYWDFWERELRRDGVSLFAADKRALGG